MFGIKKYDIISLNGEFIKMKKNSKVNWNVVKYTVLGCVFVLCIVNLFILIKAKNDSYDTFYAKGVSFVAKDDNSFQMSFDLKSAQGKSYSGKELNVYFKCYDESGVMLIDSVSAVVDGDELGMRQIYDADYQQAYANDINRCELNYVQINN